MVPVTTQGGMTGLVRGGLPNANEVVLSMELMNKVEEVDTSTGVAIAHHAARGEALEVAPPALGGRAHGSAAPP